MNITIECIALQLKTIGIALHMFDYSIINETSIPKEGWALASICQEWIEREIIRKERDREQCLKKK